MTIEEVQELFSQFMLTLPGAAPGRVLVINSENVAVWTDVEPLGENDALPYTLPFTLQ